MFQLDGIVVLIVEINRVLRINTTQTLQLSQLNLKANYFISCSRTRTYR